MGHGWKRNHKFPYSVFVFVMVGLLKYCLIVNRFISHEIKSASEKASRFHTRIQLGTQVESYQSRDHNSHIAANAFSAPCYFSEM